MPVRLWFLLAALFGAIGLGAGFALYVGIQEVRLHRTGPRRQILAEEITGQTRGWLLVLGCARHDLEVAVDADGFLITGERGAKDRIYFPLTSQRECDDDTRPEALHVYALVESSDAISQGLSRLYDRGYQAPPTQIIVEGVVGFGAGDGWREQRARRALAQRLPALAGVPLLVKDRRPGSPAAAYATVAVGAHGLLLLLVLGWLGARRALRRGLPRDLQEFIDEGDDAASA